MFNHTNQNVQTFSSSQFGELRVNVSNDGKIWFCLSDVCQSLGLGNASQTKSRLKAEGVTVNDTPTKSGMQQMLFIDEPNLYRCVFQSRKQEAEKFQDWVCEEVLPSIRKSGGYIVAKQDESPEVIMARALQIANETIERNKQRVQMLEGENASLQEQNRILAPKAQYTDEVLQSDSTYTLTQVAHDLGMLSEVASEHCIVVSGIVNGPGNCRRADDENPSAVLAELREYVDLGRSASVKKVSEFENSIATARILLEALLDELDKE